MPAPTAMIDPSFVAAFNAALRDAKAEALAYIRAMISGQIPSNLPAHRERRLAANAVLKQPFIALPLAPGGTVEEAGRLDRVGARAPADPVGPGSLITRATEEPSPVPPVDALPPPLGEGRGEGHQLRSRASVAAPSTAQPNPEPGTRDPQPRAPSPNADPTARPP